MPDFESGAFNRSAISPLCNATMRERRLPSQSRVVAHVEQPPRKKDEEAEIFWIRNKGQRVILAVPQ
jgi:hypothetical protein